MIYTEVENTFIENDWVYNPIMATLDGTSKQIPNPEGNNEVNSFGAEKILGDRIRISFIKYVKVTDDHVDEYAVVNQSTCSVEDAKKFSKAIEEVLNK
jgi:hypothetical protein